MIKVEYTKGQLLVDGFCRYCPIHGGGGEVCGSWCAMFEVEIVDRGMEFVVCHAYKTKFLLSPSHTTEQVKDDK